MGSKEDILVRLKKHAVDQVERPEMTFEPLTFFDPLVQFEKIMKAVGGNCVVLVLTVIVEMAVGDVDDWFWYRLGAAIILFFAFVMIVFPIVGRWFFKRCEDNVSQYIFVLVMVFLGNSLDL